VTDMKSNDGNYVLCKISVGWRSSNQLSVLQASLGKFYVVYMENIVVCQYNVVAVCMLLYSTCVACVVCDDGRLEPTLCVYTEGRQCLF